MKILNKIIDFFFGFSECKRCNKKNNCNKKPWLHEECDCQYRIENNYKGV